MVARVGVQHLFRRGAGVEQRESGSAVDVLVVPREQQLDGNGDASRRLVHEIPFGLTAGEKRLLLAARRGQGLLIAGTQRTGFEPSHPRPNTTRINRS